MIVFAWNGFPQYAARCIGAFVAASLERVVVIATRPAVPIVGMEKACGSEIFWIQADEKRTITELVGDMPRVIFLSGWSVPAFNRYRDEVRKAGGRVIGMADNNYMLTVKTLLNSIRFRLLFRNKYDFFFVPGESGRKFMRLFGFRDDRVETGVYAADGRLFHDGPPVTDRPKKVIYVGQLCKRKNVLRLLSAFGKANDGSWQLELYGCGPLEASVKEVARAVNEHCGRETVIVNPFMQPESLAEQYRTARVFCLPSLLEHWGLVVHEAALSGCVLLLGNRTGAADDFLSEGRNGRLFNPYAVKDMAHAMKWAMGLSDAALLEAQAESLRMARNAGLEKFVKSVKKLIGEAS